MMYEDGPGLRPVELSLLSAQAPAAGNSDDKQLDEFYSRFERIKDFHQKNTNINARELINAIDDMVNDDGIHRFTVEDENGNEVTVTENRGWLRERADISFGQCLLWRRGLWSQPGPV